MLLKIFLRNNTIVILSRVKKGLYIKKPEKKTPLDESRFLSVLYIKLGCGWLFLFYFFVTKKKGMVCCVI